MASVWLASFAFIACLVLTIVISMATKQTKTDADLTGLVYSLTPKIKDRNLPWHKQPATLAIIVLICTAVLNIIFW